MGTKEEGEKTQMVKNEEEKKEEFSLNGNGIHSPLLDLLGLVK
jgi:hypothetical protein